MIHISLCWFSDMCIPPASGIILHLSSCLIPVFNLVVLIVVFDDIDDISFSKRRKSRGYTYLCAGSVICVSRWERNEILPFKLFDSCQ